MSTLHVALQILSDLVLAAGVLFVLTGAAGLHRLPEFFMRTHAASITDSAGAGLIVLGLLLRTEEFATALRLVLIAFFLMFTSPTASHALAQAALGDGFRPQGIRGRKTS
ncbi:MAG: monovalent cation/H(+) antiporter subunit G [Sinimarinibacterium flocculans]|uniref:monovalent cation/H(+) antiporter subunit G n=1 Tax=Sinimarinibacterium flocculans TaxID=985250 RepID=UPI0024930209|nr:monovalent cation/H(+) antiporter subunit G [Sinimarinibacterium flocculans]MEC9364584.1 monovalent cation/H(+) antiporter subunit G [Pseudomonadota bacterium]